MGKKGFRHLIGSYCIKSRVHCQSRTARTSTSWGALELLLIETAVVLLAGFYIPTIYPCTVICLNRITLMQCYLKAPLNFIKYNNIFELAFSLVSSRLSSSLKIANFPSANQHSAFWSLLYLRYGPMTKLSGSNQKIVSSHIPTNPTQRARNRDIWHFCHWFCQWSGHNWLKPRAARERALEIKTF